MDDPFSVSIQMLTNSLNVTVNRMINHVTGEIVAPRPAWHDP